MSRSAPSDPRAFRLGLAGIALLTLWRVALLPFDSADLFVDDAQYWFWGQELAWGYYSKPPLIGWILRASTEIGSDAPFWIRLPMPLIHCLTSVLVALVARHLFGARVGGVAGFAFASLPGVAVASLLVSTDTPMLACFALALLAQVHLVERRSIGWAIVLGAAVGVGLLAKYAMIYFPLSAVAAAALLPAARIAWRDAAIAAALALALVAPNLIWNAGNEFATLHHTADNTRLASRAAVYPGRLLEFWGGQFAIAGPVFFAAFLAGLGRLRGNQPLALLALMALPAFAIVSVQALLAGAQANWAAAGHVAALVLAAAVLTPRPRLLAAGLAINLAVALALPVAAVFADSWRIGGGNLVLARWVGPAEVSRRAAEIARAEGLDTIVSDSRELLADLFYTLRDSGLAIHAPPPEGFPAHHYAQKHPLPPGPGDVLYVTHSAEDPDCAGATPVTAWRPELGFFTGEIRAYRIPRACWHPGPK
jgi:4-amino-4-deoxy-L-arabinose transferase-like glycosyltransferase